jgi:WD40 repeat protein/DNA-binding SARP family transcriptional activator
MGATVAQLTINLLGSFQVQRNRALVTRFRGNKVRALLAYLAVEADQHFTRSALAGLLWPDQPERLALRNLTQALIRLGEALGDLPLLVTRHAIQWHEEAAEVDVRLFARLAQSHETADLVEAAALYRGELLAGFSLPGCEAFEEWLLIQRERLLQQAITALHTLAEQHLVAGRLAHAAASARRQLELDPWREPAHRQLMRALALGGDRGAALAQYAACCQVLESALGVEPDEQTHALYEQIRTNTLQSADLRPVPSGSEGLQIDQARLHAPIDTLSFRDEAPGPGRFYGRQAEISQLRRWLIDERCQLVAVLGIGGVGKTSLAATLVQASREQFEQVIWRSLLNAPPLEELLRPLLLDYLRKQRCLLVLDNLESLLEPDGFGQMRAGYEGYTHLLQRLAHSKHQSCLLLTSRERPRGMARWEADLEWVRTLRLEGLDPVASQAILNARGLRGQEVEAQELIGRYSGHPLALKLVAETVQELFGGAIGAFLREEALIFDDIRAILDQQFARLSALEQQILFWLAIEREPVHSSELGSNLVCKPPSGQFLETLRALQRRSLLEQHAAGFTLQNVVIEYLTARLIDGVCAELTDGVAPGLPLLTSFALLKAQAKEYVRQSQERLILQPIAERLLARLGQAGLETALQRLLASLRAQPPRTPGYAAGNILNLLVHIGAELRGYNFAGLSVWQACLQGVSAPEVSLAGADLRGSAFTSAFQSIKHLAWSPAGQFLAACTMEGTIYLWRAGDWPAAMLNAHARNITAIAFDPSGRLLANGGFDGTLRVWNVETGELGSTLHGHTNNISSIAFSPDGARLASSSDDHTVRVWDSRTGQLLHTLRGHIGIVASVAFSPDGSTLASGGWDHTVRVWDSRTGQLLRTLLGHTHVVCSVACSPDGSTLASGGWDHTVRVWDSRTGQLLHTLVEHNGPIACVVFSPNGALLASGGDEPGIHLWSVPTSYTLYRICGQGIAAGRLAFSPDSRLLMSGAIDQTIRILDVQTGQSLQALHGYDRGVADVACSPDGAMLISADRAGELRLWDLNTHRVIARLRSHTAQVKAVTFSADGRLLASVGNDQTVRLWDARSRQLHLLIRTHAGRVNTLAFSPDGRWLASAGNDQLVRIWDARTGFAIATLTGHTDFLQSVAFSPDSTLFASAGNDQTIRVWDVKTRRIRHTLHAHTDVVMEVAWSPNGEQLASGSWDRTVRVWDLDSQQVIAVLEGHTEQVESVAWSPIDQLVASGGADHTIHLWDVRTGCILHTLHEHTANVGTLVFSPDGRRLISGSSDETIKLWDVATGACVATLHAEGPYAGMDISGAVGISDAQRVTLMTLGAVDDTTL